MSTEILNEPLLRQLALAYIFGVLSSLTPCVYPLIPVTLAVCGAKEHCDRLRRMAVVSSYVGGIALTYTLLGVISAQSGSLFGSLLANRWATLALVAFLIFLAFYVLDLFNIPAFSRAQTWASRIGGGGARGAFLMGTVSGVVAAPCIGPVLIVILGVAASSSSAWRGGALLFSYSLGLGTIFIILGIFSSLLHHLPKSGVWLRGVKFLIASALFGVAVYFIETTFAVPWKNSSIFSYRFSLLGIAVFGTLLARGAYVSELNALKPLLACLVGFSGYHFLSSSHQQLKVVKTDTVWLSKIADGVAQGRKNKMPIMVDLFAEWCAACKELDLLTFPDDSVQKELSRFVKVRVDFTNADDYSNEIASRFSVVGLPCILFLNSDGEEIPGTRISGFLEPLPFLAHLRDVSRLSSR